MPAALTTAVDDLSATVDSVRCFNALEAAERLRALAATSPDSRYEMALRFANEAMSF